MEKVYKLTLIPILSLFILLATFLVGCSNKPTVKNNTPTYPQTFETDTSRNIAQELVKYLRGNDQTTDYKRSYFYPDIFDSNKKLVASDIELCHFLSNNMLELRADFSIIGDKDTNTYHDFFMRIYIPVSTNYNITNYVIRARNNVNYYEYFATIPNTNKDFREHANDKYPIRTIDFDSGEFFNDEHYLTEITLKLGKCVSATLQVFDSFFRNKLKYFPNKLEDGTILPTEVSQYAILSYFHLPVAVKINPQVKS